MNVPAKCNSSLRRFLQNARENEHVPIIVTLKQELDRTSFQMASKKLTAMGGQMKHELPIINGIALCGSRGGNYYDGIAFYRDVCRNSPHFRRCRFTAAGESKAVAKSSEKHFKRNSRFFRFKPKYPGGRLCRRFKGGGKSG